MEDNKLTTNDSDTVTMVYFIYSFTYTNLFHHATEKSRKTKRGRGQTMNDRRDSEDNNVAVHIFSCFFSLFFFLLYSYNLYRTTSKILGVIHHKLN